MLLWKTIKLDLNWMRQLLQHLLLLALARFYHFDISNRFCKPILHFFSNISISSMLLPWNKYVYVLYDKLTNRPLHPSEDEAPGNVHPALKNVHPALKNVHPALKPKLRKVFTEVNIKRGGRTGEGVPATENDHKNGSLGSGDKMFIRHQHHHVVTLREAPL